MAGNINPTSWIRVPNGGTPELPSVYTAIREALQESADAAKSLQAQINGLKPSGSVSGLVGGLAGGGVGIDSGGGSSGGSVTSVGLALSTEAATVFGVSGSPITTAGDITVSLDTQAANKVFAGPTTGADDEPTFRSLVAGDIPSLSSIYLPLAGGTLTGRLNLPASVASPNGAQLNLGSGATPSSFADGDVWINALGFNVRVAGSSLRLFPYEGGQFDGTVTTKAGTASAAGFILASGTNLTTPAAGAVEFDGSNLYFTPSSTRKTVAFTDSDITGTAANVTGTVAIANGGTNLTSIGSANQVLGVNSGTTALEYKTVTAGTGISITHAAGSITVTNTSPSSGGTVTSVTGTSPISVANGTTTPAISLGTVEIANGGTGLTTYTAGDLLYYSTGTALSKLAAVDKGILYGTASAPAYTAAADMAWDNTNKRLGIGTDTPQVRLHVDDTAAPLDTDLYNNIDLILAVNNGGTGLRLVSATTDPTSIANVPAVVWLTGRGTPSAATAVNSGDYLGRILVQGIATAGGRQVAAELRATVDAAPGSAFVPGRFEFFTTSSSGTQAERMRLTSDGYLGIGKTPSTVLDIVHTVAGSAAVNMSNSSADPAANARYILNNSATSGGLQLRSAAHATEPSDLVLYSTANNIRFYTSGNFRMSVGSTGNILMDTDTFFLDAASNEVGIGTTGPQQKLDVAGTLIVTGNSDMPASAGTNVRITGGYASPDIGRIFIGDGSGWKLHFSSRTASANTDRVTFTDEGRVGIGVTSPGTLLHLGAGTATVAPFRLTSGINLTTATAGSMEFDGTNLYFTPTSTRKTVAFTDSNITGTAANVTGTVGVANGGTGLTSFTAGQILYASATTTIAGLSVTTGGLLYGGATAPAYTAIADLNWDNTNKRLGISQASPSYKLTVLDNNSALSTSNRVVSISSTISNTVSNGNTQYGIYNFLSVGNNITGTPHGIYSIVDKSGGANLTTVNAVAGQATMNSMGITVTNAAGFRAVSPTVTMGTFTNAYGLYVESQDVTNVGTGYGIYQAGTADVNYYGGRVFLNTTDGTTDPNARLLVREDVGGSTGMVVRNNDTGTTSLAFFALNTSTTGLIAYSFGSGYTTAGLFEGNGTALVSTKTNGLNIGATNGAGLLKIYTAGSATANERMRITSGGVVIVGSGEAGTAPTGNTFRAPSGTGTNIIGGTLTITAGNGTGTGGSGSIVLQTAPAGASGATANTMADRLTITKAGSVVIGSAALAQTAIDGFLYIPTVPTAGDPTNTPTSHAGRVPIVYNTGDNKIYVHNGSAWLATAALT